MADKEEESALTKAVISRNTGITISIGLIVAAIAVPYLIGQQKEALENKVDANVVQIDDNSFQLGYQAARTGRLIKNQEEKENLLRQIAVLKLHLINTGLECRLQILEQPGSIN